STPTRRPRGAGTRVTSRVSVPNSGLGFGSPSLLRREGRGGEVFASTKPRPLPPNPPPRTGEGGTNPVMIGDPACLHPAAPVYNPGRESSYGQGGPGQPHHIPRQSRRSLKHATLLDDAAGPRGPGGPGRDLRAAGAIRASIRRQRQD